MELPELALPGYCSDEVDCLLHIRSGAWRRRNVNLIKTWHSRGDDFPIFALFRGEDYFVFDFGSGFVFVYMLRNAELIFEPVATRKAGASRHYLLDQVLPRVLAYGGALVLHGAGVVVEDKVVAFAGEAGAGKSTLAASYLADGHDILNDDCLVLSRKQEAVEVRPTYRNLRLLQCSAAALGMGSQTRSPKPRPTAKMRMLGNLGPGSGLSARPLAALFFLAPPPRESPADISVRRLSPRDACMGIVANAFQLDVTDPSHIASLLTKASDVANRVPAYRIAFPRDFERLADVRAAVRALRHEWDEPAVRPVVEAGA